ncbi:MAG: class I SAM-dependent methyltransferase [Chloroflexi bacterium]|nr:class I SAM-dependent methyltransferase [Chloroflexota bacterium]
MMADLSLPPDYFARQDPSPDEVFYKVPRKVVHIDDHAVQAVRQLFSELLPSQGVYLDLMSSWRSHLPGELKPSHVIGLGMNAEEMLDNPQLDAHIVHNLNREPSLPFDDNSFDAAICTVSVQYLTQPIVVFQEVRRVLKPGALFVVSFSNRCFPSKAVAIWLNSSSRQHIELVSGYFEQAGGWSDIQHRAVEGQSSLFRRPDPLYSVWATKS